MLVEVSARFLAATSEEVRRTRAIAKPKRRIILEPICLIREEIIWLEEYLIEEDARISIFLISICGRCRVLASYLMSYMKFFFLI